MTDWTYRVSKQILKSGDTIFAIREFYPNKQGELTSWSREEVTPVGNSLEDLKGELTLIMQALDKEVVDLHYDGFGEGDRPEYDRLISESIKTLEWLRADIESKDLTDVQKVAIVQGFLNNLGENNE